MTLMQYQNSHDTSLALSSPLDDWHEVCLSANSTTDESNNKRCAAYLAKARSMKPYLKGQRCSRRVLVNRRMEEVEKIYQYPKLGKSHRTVVAMLDAPTRDLLMDLRTSVLSSLLLHPSPLTSGNWCPQCNVIPPSDLHITVAVPWWWHTMRDDHDDISREMCARLRQTVLLGMHYPFTVEIDRLVLLGGRTLVALFRTVGRRGVISDRRSTDVDPFVRLRREIVRCFTEGSSDGRRKPLTHTSVVSKPPELKRKPTIEMMTPGMQEGDGFIHCTLARLPSAMAGSDVDMADVMGALEEGNVLCNGHRMEVARLRFLHTEGKGGNSNPCNEPVFDEVIKCPDRSVLEGGEGGEGGKTIGSTRGYKRDSLKNLQDMFDGLDDEQPRQAERSITG